MITKTVKSQKIETGKIYSVRSKFIKKFKAKKVTDIDVCPVIISHNGLVSFHLLNYDLGLITCGRMNPEDFNRYFWRDPKKLASIRRKHKDYVNSIDVNL